MRAVEAWHPGERFSEAVEKHLAALAEALQSVDEGPANQAAAARAEADMRPARQAIDTMRFEVNRLSVGLAGIFDVGRLWPDPAGTRYGLGGGLRVGFFNVNVTLRYAWNPLWHRDLREGHGALFFSLNYLNLFR
jgi:hypothetical protein